MGGGGGWKSVLMVGCSRGSGSTVLVTGSGGSAGAADRGLVRHN